MLKCSIVKDILPLYIDGLTSDESSAEIKSHLDECEECRTICEKMSVTDTEIKAEERNIEPLKKINRHMIKKALLISAAAVTVLASLFLFLFVGVIPAGQDGVTMEVRAYEEHSETRGEIPRVELNFYVEGADARFSDSIFTIYNRAGSTTTNHYDLKIYPELLILPFDDRGDGSDGTFSIGYPAFEGDTLTIHFREGDYEIDLHELYLRNK